MSSDQSRNAMQAVLDRAAAIEPAPPPAHAATRGRKTAAAPKPETPAFDRPSRRNTRLIGGHFPPETARQLRILAAEEDTTIQALLEEAINLLLAKKARNRLASPKGNV
ncbi:MAG: ribbon-helix-helix domain-containing protein [Geminicoccaceae bacterium]